MSSLNKQNSLIIQENCEKIAGFHGFFDWKLATLLNLQFPKFCPNFHEKFDNYLKTWENCKISVKFSKSCTFFIDF